MVICKGYVTKLLEFAHWPILYFIYSKQSIRNFLFSFNVIYALVALHFLRITNSMTQETIPSHFHNPIPLNRRTNELQTRGGRRGSKQRINAKWAQKNPSKTQNKACMVREQAEKIESQNSNAFKILQNARINPIPLLWMASEREGTQTRRS